MNRMIQKYEVPYIADKLRRTRDDDPLYICVPGSKSITNRALLIAALSEGTSVLNGAMLSGDSRVFIECLEKLGIGIDIMDRRDKTSGETETSGMIAGNISLPDRSGNVDIRVRGCSGHLPASAALNVGSAGTAARFLTAALGLSGGTYNLDSSEQMRRRPMTPLLQSLESLGCTVSYSGETGHFPFTISGSEGSKETAHISVDISDSSQFLSALLISSVLPGRDMHIDILGTHGMAYVDMTVKMMESFGVNVTSSGKSTFVTSASAIYRARSYDIEPDASAAAYFYALSALLGIPVCVKGIHFDSLQGDTRFIRVLEQMGCKAEETGAGIVLNSPADGILHGVDIDMSAFSDQAITLAAVAVCADSPTTIRGIGHIRKQESDRLTGIATELGKMGIKTDMTEDSITIYPSVPSGAIIDTYNDHRMAMGFSILGLKYPGIVINDPGCCSKTFENFYDVLEDTVSALI